MQNFSLPVELADDENILWQQKATINKWGYCLAILVPLLLVICFRYLVATIKDEISVLFVVSVIMLIIFSLAFIYIFPLSVLEYLCNRKTYYALTNKRALKIILNPFGLKPTIYAVPVHPMLITYVARRLNGSSDYYWFSQVQQNTYAKNRNGQIQPLLIDDGFMNIRNTDALESALNQVGCNISDLSVTRCKFSNIVQAKNSPIFALRVVCTLFLLFSSFVFLTSFSSLKKYFCYTKTTAVVIDCESSPYLKVKRVNYRKVSEEQIVGYDYLCEFYDRKNRAIRIKVPTKENAPWRVGETVDVVYNPRSPNENKFVHEIYFDLFVAGILLVCLGGGFLVALLIIKRKEHHVSFIGITPYQEMGISVKT